MASREEIQIKMGIDASSIESGLSGATNYLRRWSAKAKTEANAYTDWWNSQLKQREETELSNAIRTAERSNAARRILRQREAQREKVDAVAAAEEIENAVEAARRRNRARALWRQRAEARAAAQAAAAQPAEAPAADAAGMFAGGALMAGTIAKSLKGLKTLLTFNLVGLATTAITTLISEVLPSAEEFWNRYYGVDEAASARFAKLGDNLRRLRSELQSSAADLKDKWWEYNFGNETDQGKRVMLEDRANENMKAQAANAKKILDLQNEAANLELDHALVPPEKRSEYYVRKKAEILARISEIQIEQNRLQGESLDIEKRRADLAKDMEKAKAEALKQEAEAKKRADEEERNRLATQIAGQMGNNSEFKPSIDQVAKAGQWVRGNWSGRWRWVPAPAAGIAQDALNARESALNAYTWGNIEQGDQLSAKFKAGQRMLSDMGVIAPGGDQLAEITKMNLLELQKLTKLIGNSGLQTDPSNGS